MITYCDSDMNILADLAHEADDQCEEWKGSIANTGYGYFYEGKKYILAHRDAYCEANRLNLEDIDGQVVRHSCDNPPCVNPRHLLLGTSADNVADRVARNRSARMVGTDNANSIITPKVASQIRAEWKGPQPGNGQGERTGPTQLELAEKYGVSRNVVGRIVRNQTWVES